MKIRQKILKTLYPVLLLVNRLTGTKRQLMINEKDTAPVSPIYDLSVRLNNGTELPLKDFQGKKLLIVNTASNCGYTHQYAGLQELHEKYKDRVAVIGFPANDFAEQEKGNDEEIEQFCKVNFGVNFPLAAKSTVVPGSEQHQVFRWLGDKSKNGWNTEPPGWNFTKYILDEQGKLLASFGPGVEPQSAEILQYLDA